MCSYNAECRGIVSRYCKEWEIIVGRLGRWIDFEHGYRTMEPWYMESEWWVFKSLWEKGLVYRGYRVMPFSTALTTPLSNFEAGQNYKEVSDPAIIIAFSAVDEENVYYLAWTTTPWTLPSNMGLTVHPDFEYVKIKDIATGRFYWLAECRLSALYPKMLKKGYKGGEFEIVEKCIGKDLVGRHYVPLFPYFKNWTSAFRIICDTYVTNDSGTGIVHCAPGFGEDDYRVGIEHGLVEKGGKVPCPVDLNGCFTAEVPDYQGRYVKECDNDIMTHLKAEGRLIQKASIKHSYPFCWRSDTPLIYRAIDSWFVNVTAIKDRLLANNDKTYWVPSFVKEKRFHNWLRDARDWNISRNRYWGTPLPIWISDDGEEIVVIGSIKELEELTGATVTDLHRDSIDHLTIPSKQGKGMLHRIPEVFDCWFESGSMPYAQQHYPFENKEVFEANFPAQFIAEGLDQTRGWFYTLMILSTALFDKPAFQNLIVNGLVLAQDGKKMSKRLKNYPDPVGVINKYGADSIRLYLINSPVVRAEPLRFKEEGVHGVLKDVFIPWYNAYRFLIQNIDYWETKTGKEFKPSFDIALGSSNVMDRWLLATTQELICFVRQEMEAYRLYTVVPRLIDFINSLTNCYVRLNRRRCKCAGGDTEEAYVSLCVLYECLLTLCRLMAPFTPFFTEYLYQNLRRIHPNYQNPNVAIDDIGRADSIHYVMLPKTDLYASCDDPVIRRQMNRLMMAIETGRVLRERRTISLKMPVRSVTIISSNQEVLDDIHSLEGYLMEELNCLEVHYDSNADVWCKCSITPEFSILGRKLGKDFKTVVAALTKCTSEDVKILDQEHKLTVAGFELQEEELVVKREFVCEDKNYEGGVAADHSFIVAIDTTQDNEIFALGIAREFINRIQKLRKAAGLIPSDKIKVFFKKIDGEDETVMKAIECHTQDIQQKLDCPLFANTEVPAEEVLITSAEDEINDVKFMFTLTRA